MTTINLTPLFQAVISLAAALITIYLIPWLHAHTGAEKEARITAAVHIAVYAAEKLYGAGHGDEKLTYARDWLLARGFDLDTDVLKAQINAAIREMESIDGDIYVELPEAESGFLDVLQHETQHTEN